MKQFFKILAAFAVLAFLSVSTAVAADSDADRIIGKYKKSEDVEYVRLNRILLKAAIECDEDMSGWLKGVRRMDVMIIEGGTDMAYRFSEDVSSLKEKGWSMPVKVSDGGDAVEIYAMKKGEKIREVVILVADEVDCVFVRIKGKVAESDIKDMVEGININ
ncbi:MAG: DUF4252 domain-containing protein [Bacteroidetes bacterium]|uniref:DUF4252 domain-containing protein n=1 Tax=Candidatus Merdivivens pullistercoris TaxID=2840873 RepID=A0A9D9I692_9BACT|nr:DUF4252 domain-containing protein [Candidatus Merdivivens pullistercoris]